MSLNTNFMKNMVRYLTVFKLLASLLSSKEERSIRWRFYFAESLVVATIILNVLTPIVYGRVIDILKISHPVAIVAALLISYGLVWTLSQTLVQIRGIIAFKVVRRIIRKLSLKLFSHLHNLSLRYHLDRKTGAITTSIDRIDYSVTAIFWHILFYLLPTIIEVFIIQIILMRYFEWYYAAILTLGIVAFIGFTLLCARWDTKRLQLANEAGNETGSTAVDSLLNYETVKYFNNENHEQERYDKALAAHESANVKSDITFESVNLGQNFIVGVTLTCMTLVAGLNVSYGNLTVGDFVALNAYLIRITTPLAFLGYVIRELKNAVTNFDDIIKIINETPEVQNKTGVGKINISQGAVDFKNVNFAFDTDRFALKNISFSIQPGKSLAIVGQSGSGKSTLMRLLLRLFNIQSGEILIDGQDISKTSQESVRNNIAVVPQDTILFNDSIYYNIAYAKPSATQEEVTRAAKAAHIHEYITQLPEGYKTIVGERGLKLSGGEKQRIAIARAILKQSKIYIFDEATSSLDSRTESEIQKNIIEISQGITTIIIAHRLSTVIHANKIIVMDKGEIAEAGTHDELLNRDGIYAKLWHQQVTKSNLQESLSLLVSQK